MNEILVSKIAEILEENESDIQQSDNFDQFSKFDSMIQIQIAIMLESEYNISLDPEDFEQLNSLSSINKIINLQ